MNIITDTLQFINLIQRKNSLKIMKNGLFLKQTFHQVGIMKKNNKKCAF